MEADQPSMLVQFVIYICLVVLTVGIHAAGFSALLRAIVWSHALSKSGFWLLTRLMIVLTFCLILIHLAEISVWGLLYFWQGCLPDADAAFYFSAGAYTTIGSGNLVLPEPWRLLAPLEALMGALMFGLSTGLFFAVVNSWMHHWMQRKTSSEPHSPTP